MGGDADTQTPGREAHLRAYQQKTHVPLLLLLLSRWLRQLLNGDVFDVIAPLSKRLLRKVCNFAADE